MRSFRPFAYAALIILASSVPAFSQQPSQIDPLALFDEKKVWHTGFTEAWFNFFGIPEGEIRKTIEHWENIGRDLTKATDSKSSGRYYSGGVTHGSFLRWSESNGFVWLDVDHCMGGPMRIRRGRVELVPEGILLIIEANLGNSGGHGGHGGHAVQSDRISFVSVAWNDSLFLVRKEDLDDFADYAAGLGEFNSEYYPYDDNPFFASGRSDSRAKVVGLPIFPAGYEKYLKRPVRGSVTTVGKGVRRLDPDSDSSDYLVTQLKLVIEDTTNLSPGLKLRPGNVEEYFGETFEVKSFKGKVAVIEHVRSIPKKDCVVSSHTDCKDFDHIKLRKGLTLSSNGY